MGRESLAWLGGSSEEVTLKLGFEGWVGVEEEESQAAVFCMCGY